MVRIKLLDSTAPTFHSTSRGCTSAAEATAPSKQAQTTSSTAEVRRALICFLGVLLLLRRLSGKLSGFELRASYGPTRLQKRLENLDLHLHISYNQNSNFKFRISISNFFISRVRRGSRISSTLARPAWTTTTHDMSVRSIPERVVRQIDRVREHNKARGVDRERTTALPCVGAKPWNQSREGSCSYGGTISPRPVFVPRGCALAAANAIRHD